MTVGQLLRGQAFVHGYSQLDVARRTGFSPKHINEVFQDVATVSADAALRFEKVLWIPARLLLQLDSEARLRAARKGATK